MSCLVACGTRVAFLTFIEEMPRPKLNKRSGLYFLLLLLVDVHVMHGVGCISVHILGWGPDGCKCNSYSWCTTTVAKR